MRKLFATTAAASLLAAPAFAGALIYEPAPEPAPVVQPVAMQPVLPSWTGFYGGVHLGWADADFDGQLNGTSFDTGEDDFLFGAHVGYDWDFGNNWVVGGEIAYDRHDLSVSDGGFSADLDNALRLTARGGYAFDNQFGSTLVYAKGGAEWLDGDVTFAGSTESASDWGWVAGAGVEHMVTDQVSAGVEYLYHSAEDFGRNGVDLEMNTLAARISYRF